MSSRYKFRNSQSRFTFYREALNQSASSNFNVAKCYKSVVLNLISLPNPYAILHDFVEPQFFYSFYYKPTTFNHNTNKYIAVSMCFLLFFSGDQLRNSRLCFRNSNSQVIFTCKPISLLCFDFHQSRQSRKHTLA